MQRAPRGPLRGCSHCGLVQQVPTLEPGAVARCARCDGVVYRPGGSDANRLCAALALAALICYPLGISLPALRLEQLGHVHETSIWGGTISLLAHGQFAVGLVVLACSLIIPVMKLVGLFVLASGADVLRQHHRGQMYRWLEWLGRWGMIDVLLVAIVVAAVKVGDLATVTPGPGIVAFTACVVLSLLATIAFNPHAIWER